MRCVRLPGCCAACRLIPTRSEGRARGARPSGAGRRPRLQSKSCPNRTGLLRTEQYRTRVCTSPGVRHRPSPPDHPYLTVAELHRSKPFVASRTELARAKGSRQGDVEADCHTQVNVVRGSDGGVLRQAFSGGEAAICGKGTTCSAQRRRVRIVQKLWRAVDQRA